MLATQKAVIRAGGEVQFVRELGDPYVSHARNLLARRFLREFSDFDRLLWIDDDMTFTVQDVNALIECTEDVIGGLYSRKVYPLGSTVIRQPRPERSGKKVTVLGLGTGFLAMSRTALAAVCDAHNGVPFVDGYSEDGSWWMGEDYRFCERWRALGGKVWAHEGVRLGHVGPHTFGVTE